MYGRNTRDPVLILSRCSLRGELNLGTVEKVLVENRDEKYRDGRRICSKEICELYRESITTPMHKGLITGDSFF